MSHTQRLATLLMIVTSCCAFAPGQVPHRQWKYEGGLVISWDPVSSDAGAKQVGVSNENGQLITNVDVLGPVHDARRVSIYDVSARGNLIAVAAVYESKEGNRQIRPTATLLLFDFSGQFLSAFALEPSHQIALLAVDDNSDIWTLTDHADTNVDPSKVPMVVKYTSKGKIAKELLPRNLFPFHASDIRQNTEIGAPAMGYEAGVVWFWLPGSTDFVTISTSDNKITRATTSLPQRAGHNVVPLSVRRELSGTVVVQAGENDQEGNRVPAHYRWSPNATWARFKPDNCEGGSLIGVGTKGQMYLVHPRGSADLCRFGSTQ
jgi:hypothetical protein